MITLIWSQNVIQQLLNNMTSSFVIFKRKNGIQLFLNSVYMQRD